MAQFLSDEWFEEMQSVTTDPVDTPVISIREVITDSPFGTIIYVMRVAEDGVVIDRSAEDADVIFTQDYETAVALHKGELTTKEAFFAGRVKVGGQLSTLQKNSGALATASPLFADVRSRTTY